MNNDSMYPSEAARRFERKPLARAVEYVMNVPGSAKEQVASFTGRTVDISEAGLGIETDYPLAPGHTLWVNGGIDRAGKVQWAVRTDMAYRAGIQFDLDGILGKGQSVGRTEDLTVGEEREGYLRRLDNATESFMKQLETIEKRSAHPAEDPKQLQGAVAQAVEQMMSGCKEFEGGIGADKQALKEAQVKFREKTHPLISKSYLMNRTRVWPQGSQGDYKTLDLAYKNTPLSEGLGYHLDLYMLELPLAHAVRNRIRDLEDILRDDILKRKEPALLNIACGSSRELMGLAPEIRASGARITCIDTDDDALSFAQNRISYTGAGDHVEFRKYNALRLFDYDLAMSDFGKQDIIYSVGLFDYLPSDFLVRMFGTLYRLLNEGGTLVLAFKDAARYDHHIYHWLVDWDGFQQRKEDDFKRIIAESGFDHSSISERRDETGLIVFYLVSKGQETC